MVLLFVIIALVRVAQVALVCVYANNPVHQWAFVAFIVITAILFLVDMVMIITFNSANKDIERKMP